MCACLSLSIPLGAGLVSGDQGVDEIPLEANYSPNEGQSPSLKRM